MATGQQTAQSSVRFGVYEFDLHARELRKRGVKLKLEGQPLQILEVLLRNPGQLVTREELRTALWPAETFVDYEQSINAAVKRLRQALDDSADVPVFIETLPRRGYRFIFPLGSLSPSAQLHPPRKRRATMIAVLIVVTASVALIFSLRSRPSMAAGTRITIVPFVNASGDPNQDLLAAKITEGLIDEVLRIHDIRLKVQPPGKVAFADQGSDPSQQEALITGSVLRKDGAVTVTILRMDPATGKRMWAQSFSHDSRDLRAAERDSARAIADALNIKLSRDEAQRLASHQSREGNALLLRGRASELSVGQANALKAIDLYEQAVARDPEDAFAHAELATSYTRNANMGYVAPRDIWSKAKAHALKAIELDATLPEAHVALSNVYRQLDWDFAKAAEEAQRAVDLDHSFAEGYDHYSAATVAQGRFEEAIATSRRAQELDPAAINYVNRYLSHLYAARKYHEAIQEAAHALTRFPRNETIPHMVTGLSYLQLGQPLRALSEVQSRFGIPTAGRRTLSALPYVYAMLGRRKDARQAMNEVLQLAEKNEVPPYEVAIAYTGLGDKEAAIAWLEKAYAKRDTYMQALGIEPMFDPLRSDPRFLKIVQRVKDHAQH